MTTREYEPIVRAFVERQTLRGPDIEHDGCIAELGLYTEERLIRACSYDGRK